MTTEPNPADVIEALRRLIRIQFRLGRALYAIAMNTHLARVGGHEWVKTMSRLASDIYADGNYAAQLLCRDGPCGAETWLSGDGAPKDAK